MAKARNCDPPLFVLSIEGLGLIALKTSNRFLPVLPIELHHLGTPRLDTEVVQCAHVHRVQIRRTAWTSEYVDAANCTEVVLGFTSTETVGAQPLLPAEQPEAARLDRMMQGSLLTADGAVALDDTLDQTIDLETHALAMTRPGVALHLE